MLQKCPKTTIISKSIFWIKTMYSAFFILFLVKYFDSSMSHVDFKIRTSFTEEEYQKYNQRVIFYFTQVRFSWSGQRRQF